MDFLNKIRKIKALRAQSIVWKKAKARDAEEKWRLRRETIVWETLPSPLPLFLSTRTHVTSIDENHATINMTRASEHYVKGYRITVVAREEKIKKKKN